MNDDPQAYRAALKDIESELRVLAGRLQSVADLALMLATNDQRVAPR